MDLLRKPGRGQYRGRHAQAFTLQRQLRRVVLGHDVRSTHPQARGGGRGRGVRAPPDSAPRKEPRRESVPNPGSAATGFCVRFSTSPFATRAAVAIGPEMARRSRALLSDPDRSGPGSAGSALASRSRERSRRSRGDFPFPAKALARPPRSCLAPGPVSPNALLFGRRPACGEDRSTLRQGKGPHSRR
jgi:hypothetical protein